MRPLQPAVQQQEGHRSAAGLQAMDLQVGAREPD